MALNDINPIRRLEFFLQDIADGKTTPTKTPIRRLEEFLRRIAVKVASGGSGGGGINVNRLVAWGDSAIPTPPAGYTPDPAKYFQGNPVPVYVGSPELYILSLSIPISGPGTAGPTWLYDNLVTSGEPGQYTPAMYVQQLPPDTGIITDDPGADFAYLTIINLGDAYRYSLESSDRALACPPNNLKWVRRTFQ